jgi:hypothetical protein
MADEKLIAALEALFAAVTAKARTDPAFARQLAQALGDHAKLAAAGTSRNRNADLPDLDPGAVLKAQGSEGLRRALAALGRRELTALVRARDLAPEHTSKLNKTQLIEHIVRVLARRAEPAPKRRAFDY